MLNTFNPATGQRKASVAYCYNKNHNCKYLSYKYKWGIILLPNELFIIVQLYYLYYVR